MTMKEFKKYLDNIITEKENELSRIKEKYPKHSKSYQTHLNLQIKEYKDIRKVITQ